MSTEENKAIVRRFFDALQRHDPSAAAAVMSRDVVAHFAGLPAAVQGLEAWQQLFGSYAAAFPDMQITIADELADNDKVVVRYYWSATHEADLMGIPATHRRVSELAGLGVYRIADGLIAEEWVVEDTLGLLQQIGAVPAPGQPASATA